MAPTEPRQGPSGGAPGLAMVDAQKSRAQRGRDVRQQQEHGLTLPHHGPDRFGDAGMVGGHQRQRIAGPRQSLHRLRHAPGSQIVEKLDRGATLDGGQLPGGAPKLVCQRLVEASRLPLQQEPEGPLVDGFVEASLHELRRVLVEAARRFENLPSRLGRDRRSPIDDAIHRRDAEAGRLRDIFDGRAAGGRDERIFQSHTSKTMTALIEIYQDPDCRPPVAPLRSGRPISRGRGASQGRARARGTRRTEMTAATGRRDYGLLGEDAQSAQARGLSAAQWYSAPIDRKDLKALMKRSDGPAIRDTAIWLSALLLTAAAGCALWGSWACVPFFLVYGVLYGSASDSRWHECGHGTAFKTRWMNDVVYNLASFMILREPTVWRWSHTRHHTDTIIVGLDPEIAVHRPPSYLDLLLNVFALRSGIDSFRKLFIHASGRLTAEEITFIPAMERPKVYRTARLFLAVFAGVVVACLAFRSILPAMLVGLPTFYGSWLQLMFGVTQHAGLDEDVLDHRLNSRTILMNPVFRFLYWNMNYHVEHHMFPMVPYHALPRLHQAIRQDCPEPYRGVIEAYREIIPALRRQRRDPSFFVVRALPPGAKSAAPTIATAA